MKHQYTDEQIQVAIYQVLLSLTCSNLFSKNQQISLARDLLDRLPEPPPLVVDGKTPGEVLWQTWASTPPIVACKWEDIPCKQQLEAAASAVLAAFGNKPAEIPWTPWNGGECPLDDDAVEKWEYKTNVWTNNNPSHPSAYHVIWRHENDKLIAYRVLKYKPGFGPVDWRAKYEAEHSTQLMRTGQLQSARERAEKLEEELANEKRKRLYAEEHLGILAKTFGYEGKTWCNMVSYLCPRLQKAEAELAKVIAAATRAGWVKLEHGELDKFITDQDETIEKWSSHIHPDDHDKIVKRVQDHCKAELEELRAELTQPKLSTLRPIAEVGEVPAECVRVWGYYYVLEERWTLTTWRDARDTHFADIRLPEAKIEAPVEVATVDPYAELKAAHAAGKMIQALVGGIWMQVANPTWEYLPDTYRIKPTPSTFTAHKEWTKHVPGDPMPCDGKIKIDILDRSGVVYCDQPAHHYYSDFWTAEYWNPIIGWRYADEPSGKSTSRNPNQS